MSSMAWPIHAFAISAKESPMTTQATLDQSLLYPSPLKEFWQAFAHNKGAVAGLAWLL